MKIRKVKGKVKVSKVSVQGRSMQSNPCKVGQGKGQPYGGQVKVKVR